MMKNVIIAVIVAIFIQDGNAIICGAIGMCEVRNYQLTTLKSGGLIQFKP